MSTYYYTVATLDSDFNYDEILGTIRIEMPDEWYGPEQWNEADEQADTVLDRDYPAWAQISQRETDALREANYNPEHEQMQAYFADCM